VDGALVGAGSLWPWNHAFDPKLDLGSPNHKLSFELFFWFEPSDFPSKMMLSRFSHHLDPWPLDQG
jgi:hypothetical protein